MWLTVQEIIALRRRRLGALASVTNFVLSPVRAYLSARRISLLNPLEHGYIIGLMIIGSAARFPCLAILPAVTSTPTLGEDMSDTKTARTYPKTCSTEIYAGSAMGEHVHRMESPGRGRQESVRAG